MSEEQKVPMCHKYLAILLFAAALLGCQKEAQESMAAGSDFRVEKLFTVDGCTVYRFFDASTVYFTDCSGSTAWREGCGKGCVRSVSGGGQ